MKYLLFLALLFFPIAANAKRAPYDTAIFAGGCFWCMESEFQDLKGVQDVISGYAGGPERDVPPTYEEVSGGDSGFKEAILVRYNPEHVTYQQLLDIFWSNVDPYDDKGQFCDKGSQYIAAIFYGTDEEEGLARASLKKVEDKFKQKVATQILPKTTFYPAEDHHQDFYKKNETRYKLYKNGCGRAQTLEKIWGDKPSE